MANGNSLGESPTKMAALTTCRLGTICTNIFLNLNSPAVCIHNFRWFSTLCCVIATVVDPFGQLSHFAEGTISLLVKSKMADVNSAKSKFYNTIMM